jgi:hypothetical protein
MDKSNSSKKKRSVYRSQSFGILIFSMVMMIFILVMFFTGKVGYESLIPFVLFAYLFKYHLFIFSIYKSVIETLRAIEEEEELLN